jgi:hypothetical protein
MAPGDVEAILPLGPGLPRAEWWEQVTRRRLLEARIGTCHVAAAPDGRPCYMLCVMGHADNARVRRYFGGAFPELAPDEALLEGAFTPAPFRGLGLMAAATALIAERAADIGARRVGQELPARRVRARDRAARGLAPVPPPLGLPAGLTARPADRFIRGRTRPRGLSPRPG